MGAGHYVPHRVGHTQFGNVQASRADSFQHRATNNDQKRSEVFHSMLVPSPCNYAHIQNLVLPRTRPEPLRESALELPSPNIVKSFLRASRAWRAMAATTPYRCRSWRCTSSRNTFLELPVPVGDQLSRSVS